MHRPIHVSPPTLPRVDGGNDVANAIGPFAVIIEYQVDGAVLGGKPTPMYVTVLGGVGIVVGLATWGHRVMATVGEKITKLSFTKGYAAQFGASVSVLLATVMGLPISTTAVLIGSIAGVGLASGGQSGLDLRLLGRIVAGWIITLPGAGLVTAVAYFVLRAIIL